MKIACLLLFIAFSYSIKAQTVTVGGQCMPSNITLNKITDINGKSAYQGSGTVDGIPGVIVSIYWIGAPDNVWVLDFDGQPYYFDACNTTEPTGTANSSCPWNVVGGTSCTGASALFISGVVTLPVEMVSFSAQKNNNDVDLVWKTASESNNKGFEIQRSIDAVNWKAIGFVNGAGTSSVENTYRFTDKAALAGKNYYRLLQIDFDANRKYSSIVSVDLPKKAYYSIFNNPGNGVYQLRIHTPEKVEFSVLDLSGRRLISQVTGTGVMEIDLSKHPAGTYILHLRRGNDFITEKLIKQ